MFRFLLITGLCLSLPTWPAYAQSQGIQQQEQSIRIVVLPFKNLTQQKADDWLSESFAETLSMALAPLKGFQVLERTQIKKIIKEQMFAQSAYADPGSAPELGKLLGAQAMILGSYQKIGSSLQANVRMVDVLTGQIDRERTLQIEGTSAEILKFQKQLISKFQQKLQLQNPQKILPETTEQAHKAFHLGLQFLDYQGSSTLQASIEYFQQALKSDPELYTAHASLSEAYARLAQFEAQDLSAEQRRASPQIKSLGHKLEQHAQWALHDKNQLAKVYRALARFKFAQGQPEQALDALKQSLLAHPHSNSAIQLYFQIQNEIQGHQQNAQSLRTELEALGVKTDHGWLEYEIVKQSLIEASDPRAIQLRKQLLELLNAAESKLPHFPGISLLRAKLSLASGKRAEALIELKKTLKKSQNFPLIQLEAAELFGVLGQRKQALDLLEEIRGQVPPQIKLSLVEARLLTQEKRFQEANRLFLELFKSAPNDPRIYYERGLIAFTMERKYDKAAQYLEQALKFYRPEIMDFSAAQIEYWLVYAYLNHNQEVKAIPLLQKLVQNPEYRRGAMSTLSTAYAKTEKYKEARSLFENYIQHYPHLAQDKYHQQKYKEFVLLERLQRQPANLADLLELGNLYKQMGLSSRAQIQFKKILKHAPNHKAAIEALNNFNS